MKLVRSLRRKGLIVPLLLVALACSACVRSPEAKSAASMEAGKKLLEQKDAARAILQFRNATQATPADPETHYQLALAYLAAGDVQRGVVSLRKALELNPKHIEAQLRLTQLLAATVDSDLLKDAQHRLKVLLQDAPDNADALHALALTELKLGEPEDAMEHLERAMAAAPQELLIVVTMAQARLQQKDPKRAEEVLKKAVENSPKSAGAHLVLADFYFSQRRMPEAEAELKVALGIDPKSGLALMQLTRVQLAEGRKQEAEQNFKQLSGFGGYESIYGTFLFEEGRRDEAVREFEKMAKAYPDDRQIRTNLVTAYQGANRLSNAKKILDDILKKNPKDLDALLQRGELLIGSREYAQAEADLSQVLKLKPDSPEIHYVVAKLNQARGNQLIYRQGLTQALKLNPYLLPVRLEAAQEFISSNNARAALDLLNQTPELQRASVPVLVTRNWALWTLEDMSEMRKGIDRALAQGKSPELLLQDGLWKLRSGQPSVARASLEQALNMDPADLRALSGLTRTYGPKEAPIALQKVKEYAARQPKSAPVQDFLGMLLMVSGDRAGARRAYETAKAADPKFLKSDLSLVQMDVLEGRLEDARKRLQALLAAEGERALAVRLWLGNVEEALGNHIAAIEQFQRVVDGDSSNVQALNNLAYLLAEYGNQPDQALKYAEKAVEIAPNEPMFADTLGWVLYRKGTYSVAVQHLARGAAKMGCIVCQYHLAMAFIKSGQPARGRTVLEAALHLNPNLPEAKMAKDLLINQAKLSEAK